MRPHLPRYGVTLVADVTGLDVIGIPACMAVRPLARTLSVSQGKGYTMVLAKISAVMESIELWHAEYGCPPPPIQATPLAELDLPYHLDQVDNYRGGLIGDRTELDWLRGAGLVSGRPQLLPRHMAHVEPAAEPTGGKLTGVGQPVGRRSRDVEDSRRAGYRHQQRQAVKTRR